MSLAKAMEDLKYDSRLTEYNLNSGILSQEELKKHLQSLPDLAPQTEKLDLERRERSEQH